MSRRLPTHTALDRLREFAVDGPPFLYLVLDEPTVRCLALGSVNSRAQVAAQRLVESLEAHTLGRQGASR